MASTRDPILLLEPSNLLEPLNLTDRYVEPANLSARLAGEGTSSRRFMRPVRRDSISASAAITRDRSSRDRSWRLKSAVLVAGAFACFAAGAALPQLSELTFGDAKLAQQTKPAQQTNSAQRTQPAQQTVADTTKRSAPVADAPVKSEESKPTEPKPNESAPNGSNQSVALTANTDAQSALSAPGQNASTAQSAPAAPAADAGVATSCSPQNRARDDKCLEGGVADPAAASRTTGASTVKSPAAPQSIWEIDERAQQSVNRRAAQRDAADQQAATDNNGQSAKSWDRDRRQEQDSNRASSRRRERPAADNGQTARYGDSRQEQDTNRNSNWRRDRYDEYVRGDDRRVFGRARRDDDDRVIGGGPRHDGPIPIFPSLFGW
jgi:hypothetical protein